MVRIAVIGAGIVGLATATNVQKRLPNAKITIVADKFDTDTTSSGAGGLYRPTAHHVKGVPPETIKAWSQDAWEYYTSLAMSPEAKDSGHSLVPGFMVSNNRSLVMKPVYEDTVFNFRIMSSQELKRMNLPYKYGSTFMTVITQPKKFMPWLMRQFREKGGTVEFRTVNKIEELADSYDIVVNCSGLGSEQLVPDKSMYPVRGELVLVKAPWIKTFLYCEGEHSIYFIPHNDYVIVGGTRDRGNYSLEGDKEVQKAIMRRAEEVLPQIKGGEVVGTWVGLRPSRDPLRLEKELLNVGGKKLRVVHNYGHGANGVTLSWGTSLRAATMVEEWASQVPTAAKL